MAFSAEKVMSGTHCKIFYDGKWIANASAAELQLDIEKVDVKIAGSRATGTKVVGYKGTGSITTYKMTSALIEAISSVVDDSKKPFICEMQFVVADPDSGDQELRIRVKDVSFDRVDLVRYSIGELITEELPFTFTTFEFMSTISE
jgi:hypothetical protein